MKRKHNMSQLELKHVRGIPYYIKDDIVYTFELNEGRPGDECQPIGTYDEKHDSITYVPDWKELVQPRLDAFRGALLSQDRKTLRESIIKPQKQKKATRTPRKPSARAKSAAST